MSSPLRGLKIPKKRKRNASNPLVFFRAGYEISFEVICVSGKENDEPVPNKRSRQRSANELVNDVLRNIDLSEPDVVQALLAQTQAALLKTVPITNPLLVTPFNLVGGHGEGKRKFDQMFASFSFDFFYRHLDAFAQKSSKLV